MTITPATASAEKSRPAKTIEKRRRKPRRATSLFAHGEPMVWLCGGAMALSLFMIVGLLALVLGQGGTTFWPLPVVQVTVYDGASSMGEISAEEEFRPGEDVFARMSAERALAARSEVDRLDGLARRRMLRTGNYELTGEHFRWISDFDIVSESRPDWALVVERMADGRFYGIPSAFQLDGETVATEPEPIWQRYEEHHRPSRERFERQYELETDAIGAVNREVEKLRLALREIELAQGRESPLYVDLEREVESESAGLRARYEAIEREIARLEEENTRYQLVLSTASGETKSLRLADIVRAYPANRLTWMETLRVYCARWWEFLSAVPRESNSEGGVFPAIFGTVVMTLVMSLMVVPFGVLAALYLREYAKAGFLVSIVRIAVNNLAGVPSIVFGVFGLGFFCYIVGASIDELFYSAKLPSPTFGTGGLLWASLTLALLTLPVVIVATEEALAAVPGSMREGSYACGATKWQTIQRIVLPRAMPGIMTGMILAIARGAGEVAPLMLVGVVKLAPALAVDGVAPFFHPERSFMHLGFHIFDLGFHSQNSEAAKPMVYTTTLLLIGIIIALNVTAIWVRARLRKRFLTVQI